MVQLQIMTESVLLSLWHVCIFYRWACSLVAISHSDSTNFPNQGLHLTSGFISSSSVNEGAVSLQNKVRGLETGIE